VSHEPAGGRPSKVRLSRPHHRADDDRVHHRQNRPRRAVFSGQGHIPAAGGDAGHRRCLGAAGNTVRQSKVWGARPARIGILLLAAAVLAVCAPFLRAGESTLLFNIFIFIPASFGIMFASLWLLTSDIFEDTPKSEAAPVFAKIGASSLAGGIAGGFVAKGLVPYLEPQWLIFISALLIVAVTALVAIAHRKFPTRIVARKADEKKDGGYLKPLSNPYALSLILISMTGALAGLLIDVQFYITATSANLGSKGNAGFFANFYIMLNFFSLIFQLFITPRIQRKIGIHSGLMILPFALVGGAGFASAAATAFSLSVLRVTEGGLRSSIHRSLWEQAFIPIVSRDRSVVKLAVDGIAARIAEGAAAAGLFFWVQHVAPGGVHAEPLDTRWMIWLTFASVVAWLAITHNLRLRVQREQARAAGQPAPEIDCERFPDQCPCTTELGKGIR
jgi:ATP/ADP translocase